MQTIEIGAPKDFEISSEDAATMLAEGLQLKGPRATLNPDAERVAKSEATEV
ncbi:MAG TPA: hypothetical protein VGN25_07225 [Solirubrobacteraceae bacterium]|nr:hypothetical protein [Solirubrobacteraceae bacterium]